MIPRSIDRQQHFLVEAVPESRRDLLSRLSRGRSNSGVALYGTLSFKDH